jgi:hypothetical protein
MITPSHSPRGRRPGTHEEHPRTRTTCLDVPVEQAHTADPKGCTDAHCQRRQLDAAGRARSRRTRMRVESESSRCPATVDR